MKINMAYRNARYQTTKEQAEQGMKSASTRPEKRRSHRKLCKELSIRGPGATSTSFENVDWMGRWFPDLAEVDLRAGSNQAIKLLAFGREYFLCRGSLVLDR